MKKTVLGLFVLGVLLIWSLTGCAPSYKIQPEKDKYYVPFGGETKINFDVSNPGETTLFSKVEVSIINSETQKKETGCFRNIPEKELSAISPKSKTSASIQVVSEDYGRDKEECKGRIFDFTLLLEDVTGKIIAKSTTQVSITQ